MQPKLYKRTACLCTPNAMSVDPIHSTNENQHKAVIAIVRSVFGQQNGACMKLALLDTVNFKHTQ